MGICRECAHWESCDWDDRNDCYRDCCRPVPDEIDHVTGAKIHQSRHCSDLNFSGECGLYRRASWLKRLLIFIKTR